MAESNRTKWAKSAQNDSANRLTALFAKEVPTDKHLTVEKGFLQRTRMRHANAHRLRQIQEPSAWAPHPGELQRPKKTVPTGVPQITSS